MQGKAQHHSDTRWYREDLQRRHAPKAPAMPTPTICGQVLSGLGLWQEHELLSSLSRGKLTASGSGGAMPREIKVVSETVAAPARQVYEFACQRENLHRWASGLATNDIEQEGDHWVVTDSPMGRIQIKMAPKNDFGVLDHDVTTPDGTTTHNAFRVTPVDEGCALSFVVLRQPGATQDEFERDAAHVTKDLKTLKGLMEVNG